MSENASAKGRGRSRGRGVESSPSTSEGVVKAPGARGRGRGRGSSNDDGSALPIDINGKKKSGEEVSQGRGPIRSGAAVSFLPIDTKPKDYKTKQGSKGQQIRLSSNHFKLEVNEGFTIIYKHHVDFSPAEDRTFMKKILLRDHKEKLNGGVYLFDGSTIFMNKNLCANGKPVDFVSKKKDGSTVCIKIKPVGTLEPGDYQYIQLFNIVIRECMDKLNLKLIRRNYFDPEGKILIPEHNLELWPGYQNSVIRTDGNQMLLQTEICTKVLRKDTALNVFQKISHQGGGDIRKNFLNAIIGCVVMTCYNSKTYKVDDVDWTANPNSTFEEDRTKKQKSYVDYYFERYSVRIKDCKQPLLVSKSSKRDRRAGAKELVYLVPELCVMTGLTDEMRLMKAVADHTNMGPSERVRRLLAFGERMQTPGPTAEMVKWNLKLDNDLIKIPGRILPRETIYLGANRQVTPDMDADWTKSLKNSAMRLVAPLTNWVLLYPRSAAKDTQNFFNVLKSAGNSMSFDIDKPVLYCMDDDRPGTFCQTLEVAINKNNPCLVMCIVMNQKQTDRYNMIKKKCIVEKPTPSQVVAFKTLGNKNLQSIATKIAIQMNCKLGGAAWGLAIPSNELMVVGFDVSHDPRDKRRSFAAMVSTLDPECVRYFSTVTPHSAGEEISVNFGMSIAKAVAAYQQRNGKLPSRIFVYRDGVGEGQLNYVKQYEVKAIKDALASTYSEAGKKLTFCFIVITKKINTRLFKKDGLNHDRYANPDFGTIVDDVITDPLSWDFFLVSQHVKHRTVAPTHYNILENTTGWPSDFVQILTYKFTHLYFNWSGTVRVPAPCQYAHKLAFLTANSVGMVHATRLEKTLYFL